MIHDSSPWKTALRRDADLIQRWAVKRAVSERRSFLLERKVFLAAYSLRKLDDATKLSTDLMSRSVGVTRYAPTKPGFSEANSHRFDQHFDLAKPERHSLTCRRLVNVLIHSLVFVEVLNEDHTIGGFMVTSDWESERGLYEVALPTYLDLMRVASADFPTDMVRVFDPAADKWITWAGYGEPPEAAQKRFEEARANLARLAAEEAPTG